MAVRMELETGGTQAAIGGAGAGKTTEMLLPQEHPIKQGTAPIAIEVSRFAGIF